MTGPRGVRLGGWGGVVLAGAVALLGAGGCLPKVSSGNAGGGAQCRMNSECTEGKVCVSGICNKPGMVKPGGGCTATRDCAAGHYCSPAGACEVGGILTEGAGCTADAACKPPLRCTLDGFFGTCSASGTADLGATCQDNKDCLTGLWCGRERTCQGLSTAFPPFVGATCADDGPFRVYFEVPRPNKPPADFFRLPFPNDIRAFAGKLAIADFPKPGPTPLGVDLVQLYVDAWTADFDGFSSIGVVTFRTSGEVNFDTAGPLAIRYVDLTPGETLGRELSRSWGTIPDRNKYACKNRFIVRNTLDAPLLPRHTYAVVLTTALKGSDGATAAPDADMTLMLASAAPSDVELKNAWDAYRPLRDWLVSKAAEAPTVAAAAVFTVADTTGPMEQVAASVAAQPPPVLSGLVRCDTGVKSPCDDGTPARACPPGGTAFDELHGKMKVPIYQQGTAPYEKPADGGGIQFTGITPEVAGTIDVCFALTVPRGAAMPASGWPLTVYHHGTGGSLRSFIDDGVAAKVAGAARPGAALGFDGVAHGARRGASTKKPDDLVFNPLNPRAARDNFLQGAADILQALRVATITVDAAASPTAAIIKFDPAALSFFGHSQGSTSGALAVAFSDAAPAVILSGAGSYLTASLLHKTSPVNISAGMGFLIGEALNEDHPVMTLFQSFFDRSDPLNYNPLIVRRPPAMRGSKHVYMSWGTDDTYTPRQTLQATAQSLGFAPVGPILQEFETPAITRPVSGNVTGGDGQKRTAAVFQYKPPAAVDGHFVATRNAEAIADWAAFLSSFVATGTPAIP